MKRNEQVYEILHQILTEQQDLLQKISPEIYTRKILSLDGATIGGHTRHIIEFLEKSIIYALLTPYPWARVTAPIFFNSS